ncbi:hypothetical protein JCM17844_20780 [Iodidimonas gelatinilytica]|uniref:Uncharacterized protein n=1 Tax=Iodidimonas gelatinilytica TaxID=1236966 RepID=A0A5A7MR73_9PROT|nr:hypothetical protein JCM17844_20780 [Iodidimonas gelatinilytica]
MSFAPIGRGMEVDLVDERILSGEMMGRVEQAVPQSADLADGDVMLKTASDEGVRLREVVNCGVPLPEYELEIRDEDGASVADREIGRIFVRGASVMSEYFNDPETTAAVLSSDGWLDTGDMGYLSAGSLFVIGRAKDMIIINGRNHWPQDIEWAAEQVDGVRSGDIAALSLPSRDHGEVPTVLVQCRVRDMAERQAFADAIKRQIMRSPGFNAGSNWCCHGLCRAHRRGNSAGQRHASNFYRARLQRWIIENGPCRLGFDL